MRIRAQRGFPLHDAQIGTARHPDLAVAPRLARHPVECVVAIGRLLRERFELAFGFVAPAHVLHHHREAVLQQRLVIRRQFLTLAVRSAHQDGRHARAFRRQKNVGVRRTPSRMGTAHVQQLYRLLPRLGAESSGAGGDEAQHSHNKSQ